MKINIDRYYGDDTVTKSHLSIEGTSFHCEAREPAYRDYTESFTGCSRHCLPRGQWKAHIKPSAYSPMTLTIQPCPGHRAAKFIHSDLCPVVPGNIVVGQSDEHQPPEKRQLERSQETFRQLEQLTYQAFANEEEISVTISNTQAQTTQPDTPR